MPYSDRQDNNDDLGSWFPVLLLLVVFPPVGLLLLFKKLMSPYGREDRASRRYRRYYRRHPYDIQWDETHGAAGMEPEPAAHGQFAPKIASGEGLTIGGSIMAAIFGFSSMMILLGGLTAGNLLQALPGLFPTLAFGAGGLVMASIGIQRTRRAKRYRKYLSLIGKRECISISSLASAMPVSSAKAMDDLQEMLDKGYLPKGYLDFNSGMLVLSDEGLPEETPEPEPAPAGMERENAVLQEIREVNAAIKNPELSCKIDRVGEITGRIFTCLREKPEKETQLRSFLSYYLPTTLKILRAYAQMEAQGIEGENINAAKKRIEGMMDQVVEGFEKQLDKLFQDDVIDITSDVAVMEQMLSKDGLSQNGGFQIGG